MRHVSTYRVGVKSTRWYVCVCVLMRVGMCVRVRLCVHRAKRFFCQELKLQVAHVDKQTKKPFAVLRFYDKAAREAAKQVRAPRLYPVHTYIGNLGSHLAGTHMLCAQQCAEQQPDEHAGSHAEGRAAQA